MITVTEAAATKAARLLSEQGDAVADMALRVSVQSGGCSGMRYDMCFDSEHIEGDVEAMFGELRVVVDPVSAPLLTGAVLDYRDGLSEQGFAITNPNAARSCGCGKSFSG